MIEVKRIYPKFDLLIPRNLQTTALESPDVNKTSPYPHHNDKIICLVFVHKVHQRVVGRIDTNLE